MRFYVESRLNVGDVQIFKHIKKVVELLPDDINDGTLGVDSSGRNIMLSCHILARAISKVFKLEYQDGYFCVGYEHSWVTTKAGHIIDVYPIGILGGPIMVDLSDPSPFNRYSKFYNTATLKPLDRFSVDWFICAVDKVIVILQNMNSQ